MTISKNNIPGNCTIIDSPRVISILGLTILLFFLGWLLTKRTDFSSDQLSGILFLLKKSYFLFILGGMAFISFLVNSKGYVIDIENDFIKFPGGGIEAQSWITYFNPIYWLQGFMRHSVHLSEICEVSDHITKKRYKDTNTGHVSITTNYILHINGDFGAISFTFRSRGKRDELYSALIQINKMGIPILNR